MGYTHGSPPPQTGHLLNGCKHKQTARRLYNHRHCNDNLEHYMMWIDLDSILDSSSQYWACFHPGNTGLYMWTRSMECWVTQADRSHGVISRQSPTEIFHLFVTVFLCSSMTSSVSAVYIDSRSCKQLGCHGSACINAGIFSDWPAAVQTLMKHNKHMLPV